MDDADDAGFSKRLKEEHDALEKYRDEQMKKLREQMQQELLQHQEALANARKQHEMALQAEQEKHEHQMMIQQAEHQAAIRMRRTSTNTTFACSSSKPPRPKRKPSNWRILHPSRLLPNPSQMFKMLKQSFVQNWKPRRTNPSQASLLCQPPPWPPLLWALAGPMPRQA